MNIVGIDMGKDKSYVVVEQDDVTAREGYVETTREGLMSYLQGLENPTIILESCSILDWAVTILDGYKIVAAHPSQVHVISSSMKKTDKNDAHTLIDLWKAGYLPTSYVPEVRIRRLRDLCRSRRFLVSKRTAIKNKLRDIAFRESVPFERFNKTSMNNLRAESCLLSILVDNLECTSKQISGLDLEISKGIPADKYAQLLKTIPGIGNYSALAISAEIGEIGRFANEEKISAYVGLVPRVFQTGNREWKGHLIRKCDDFIKYLLIECVAIHVNRCGKCFICRDYRRAVYEKGPKTARVAAARRLLKVIYYMLKSDQTFWSYLSGKGMRQWNSAAMRPS